MSERETVSYDFQANGIRDVVQAFQTIEQSMLKAERVSIESDRRAALRRLEVARTSAGQRVQTEKKAQSDITQAEAHALGKHVAFQNARDDLAKRSASKRKDVELQLYKDLDKLAEDHTRKLADETKKREKIEADAHRSLVDRRRQYAQLIGGAAVGSVRSMASTAAQWGGAALTLGGALSVGTAAQRALGAETQSVALANSMFNPNDEKQQAWLKSNTKNGRFDAKALLGFTGKVQASSGIDKGELLTGFQSYIAKSSDWTAMTDPKAQQTFVQLAQLSKATGTSFADVMNTAGSLKAQNQNLESGEMMSMMYAMAGQGKMGNIEMSDVAKYGSVITASASKYSGSQADAQKRLLGLVQVSGRAAGSAADASTGVARFGGDVAKHAAENQKRLAKEGFRVLEKDGSLRRGSDILSEYFRVTKGDTTKMGEGKGNLGLGMESIKLALGSAGVYQGAVADARAGKADKDIVRALGLSGKKLGEAEFNLIGAEAVRRDARKLEDAGYEKKHIDRDLAEVLATTQERYSKVTRDLTEKLEARVVPFLEKLAQALEKNAPELEKFIAALGDAAEWLASNPWEGLGAVIAGKITTDIASAAIGKAVESTLTSLIANSMGGGTGALAGTGLGGAGAMAAAAATQVAAIYADVLEVKNWREAGKRDGEAAAADILSGNTERRNRGNAAYAKASYDAGGAEVAMAYVAKFTDTLIDAATLGMSRVGRAGVEGAYESVTGNKARDHGLEVLRAKELVDAVDLKLAIHKAVVEGVGSGIAKANDPARNGSLTTPARGGTGNTK